MADPNWLYSATAQSAAAIVAIIGGFVSARLVGLQSEKASLERQLADKRVQLKALEARDSDLSAHPGSDERERVETDLERTDGAVHSLEERLKAFTYPNLWPGFIALAYLAVGGIVVPLALMPRGSDAVGLRIAVLTLFTTGLMGVFLFLASQLVAITTEASPSIGQLRGLLAHWARRATRRR